MICYANRVLRLSTATEAASANGWKGDDEQDRPIIAAPKGGLKRSTATHYRKGSLRRGERVGSVRRLAAAARAFTDQPQEPLPTTSNASDFKLDRVYHSAEVVFPLFSGRAVQVR